MEKEKEREPFPAGSTVLFSVDARGNIVDHAVCRDDVECGGYLSRQTELALEGAYVPGETVYCLAGTEQTDKDRQELLEDYVRSGDILDLPSLDLRSLTFIHETSPDGLLKNMSSIVEDIGLLENDPRRNKMLAAYADYHEKRETDIQGHTLSAVRTDKGILLFDDSGRGLRCMDRYLQYLADQYFSPKLDGLTRLEVYHFSTGSREMADRAKGCAAMFTPDGRTNFIPPKADYLPGGLLEEFRPAIRRSMGTSKTEFQEFVRTFGLRATNEATEIASLFDIRSDGLHDPAQLEGLKVHNKVFIRIRQRLQSGMGLRDMDLRRMLKQVSKDTADRILRTEYRVRGLEPVRIDKGIRQKQRTSGPKM